MHITAVDYGATRSDGNYGNDRLVLHAQLDAQDDDVSSTIRLLAARVKYELDKIQDGDYDDPSGAYVEPRADDAYLYPPEAPDEIVDVAPPADDAPRVSERFEHNLASVVHAMQLVNERDEALARLATQREEIASLQGHLANTRRERDALVKIAEFQRAVLDKNGDERLSLVMAALTETTDALWHAQHGACSPEDDVAALTKERDRLRAQVQRGLVLRAAVPLTTLWALERAGIHTLRDAAKLDDDALLRVRNIGAKSVAAIRDAMRDLDATGAIDDA